MAGADHKHCARCGAKCVYDADWFERLGKDYDRCLVLCEACRKLGYKLVVKFDQALADQAKADASRDGDEPAVGV